MKLSLRMLALVLATGCSLAACAQSSNAQSTGNGPSPEMRAKMQQIRDDTKAAAYNDLSAGDRAKVQAIIDQVSSGKQTDIKAAVQQIDAAITPVEAKAVVAEGAKMMAQYKTAAPPRPDATPNAARRGGMARMMNDAGAILLTVSVSREKLRELRQAAASKTTQ
jgi:hypothetical protein